MTKTNAAMLLYFEFYRRIKVITSAKYSGNDYLILLCWFAENLKCQFLGIRNLTH